MTRGPITSTAVIVAHPDDVHAHAVGTAVARRGGRVRVLDANAFTVDYDIETTIGNDKQNLQIRTRVRSAEPLELGDITGLWWRRLAYPSGGYDPHDKPHNIFSVAREERRSALLGSLDGLVPNAFNDPGRSRQAAHKPSQLQRARDLGLRIPETLITNDPDAVRSFYERMGGNAIYKMFRGAPEGLFGTRLLQQAELAILDRLKTCPAIFQEYIEGEYDIRVVVVGEEIFAARLVPQPHSELIDTRFAEMKISSYALPEELAERLLRLVADFGLVYSAIDVRFSERHGYVFFESNPEGQYLWIEIEAELPISDAIARRLLQA